MRRHSVVFFILVAVVAFAGPARSDGLNIYGGLGVDLNGDYNTPLGFGDRLNYQVGLDVPVTDHLSIAPEWEFQHVAGTGIEQGKTVKASANIICVFGNISVHTRERERYMPYGGVGFGVGRISTKAYASWLPFNVGTQNGFAIQGFGGIRLFRHVYIEVEVRRIFVENMDTDVMLNFGGLL